MKNNKLKLFTEILVILVIVLISFVGIYTQKENRMENQVKEYQYSKDLDGYREVLLEVTKQESNNEDELESSDTASENKENNSENEDNEDNAEDENKEETDSKNNYENYINSKKIIEKRLNLLGAQDYTISQNTENGAIYLQLPEDQETDHLLSNLLQIGKLEIKDSEDTSKVYVNNDNLKNVSTLYNSDTNGTIVYLKFEFNKEGKKTLKELSTGEYKTNPEETKDENEESEENEETNTVEAKAEVDSDESDETENETSSDENEEEKKDTQKKIILSIDENQLITTSFDDPIENGALNLSMNKATTDADSINNTLKSASTISSILKSGTMPLEYEIKQNSYIQTDINNDQLNKIYITLGAIFGISLIILIFKFKTKGIIAVIANIGFLALYLLVIRYTNVVVSLEAIFTGAIIVAINYLIVIDFLKMQENTKLINIFKSQIMKVMPIVLIAIVFSFVKATKLSTCGMFLFWGILVSMIYNYVLTRDMLIGKEVNIDEK